MKIDIDGCPKCALPQRIELEQNLTDSLVWNKHKECPNCGYIIDVLVGAYDDKELPF